MKKIKISLYFLLALTLTMSMSTFSEPFSVDNSKPQWKKFSQRYVTSIILGALAGVSTDIITKYLLKEITKSYADKKIEAQVLVNFFIGPLIKLIILKNVKKDMLEDNIPHKDRLMFLTALITPFRGFFKNGYLGLCKSDFCKWLLVFIKNRLSILCIFS